MTIYNYTWKIGPELATGRVLKTNKPVVENMVLIDLYTGHRYLVQKVFEAQQNDKLSSLMPGTAIQTWPVGTLAADELSGLRERAKYTPSEFSRPYDDMAFS